MDDPNGGAGSDAGNGGAPDEVEKEVLDEEPRSILLGLVAQLRKGMDLSKVTLPTFVLEPRSMTERITDFLSFPGLICGTAQKTDPTERFLDVLRYYLAGFYVRPKGVKKPYNPVLGEIFRCRYQLADGSNSYFISEQVSHHPPMTAYYLATPRHDVYINGMIIPRSKFLGNSVATLMGGYNRVAFPHTHPGEEYLVGLPNIYGRGILFGTMYMELGDTTVMKCAQTDLMCDLEFQTKGFFSGTTNGLKGKVKRISTGEVLYTLSGKWTERIEITVVSKGLPGATPGVTMPFFDPSMSPVVEKRVAPEPEQEEFESRRLWSQVTKGILARDLDVATAEKALIEDNQRELVRQRAAKHVVWTPRFFEPASDLAVRAAAAAASAAAAGATSAPPAPPEEDYRLKDAAAILTSPQPDQDIEHAMWMPATDAIHRYFWVSSLTKAEREGLVPSASAAGTPDLLP